MARENINDLVAFVSVARERIFTRAAAKMGVSQSARGRKVGEFLLAAALERARAMGVADRLYLLTNTKCAAAIHLYEKLGFAHDPEIMRLFGGRYERCDVAMSFRA